MPGKVIPPRDRDDRREPPRTLAVAAPLRLLRTPTHDMVSAPPSGGSSDGVWIRLTQVGTDSLAGFYGCRVVVPVDTLAWSDTSEYYTLSDADGEPGKPAREANGESSLPVGLHVRAWRGPSGRLRFQDELCSDGASAPAPAIPSPTGPTPPKPSPGPIVTGPTPTDPTDPGGEPSPSPVPGPTPSPVPTPEPSPTPTPSPTPSPTPDPSPGKPPYPGPTPWPEPDPMPPYPEPTYPPVVFPTPPDAGGVGTPIPPGTGPSPGPWPVPPVPPVGEGYPNGDKPTEIPVDP